MVTSIAPGLRPSTAGDAQAVARILIASRAAFMPYAPSAHSDAEVHAWVREHLLPGGGVTVAVHGGAVVGLLAACHRDGVDWIDQMWLDPQWVGRGIGQRLLAHGLQRWGGPVRLWTFQANAGARRFYERHGFVPIRLTDGADNEERCPDVLYELAARRCYPRQP